MNQPSSTTRPTFLPRSLVYFMRRRVTELAALALFLVAVLLALALASYAPGDPSFNNAAGGPAANLIGRPGAFAADFLLQTLGLAGALPSLVLAGWAWRIGSHRGLRRVWLLVALMPLVLIAGATFAASLDAFEAWPLATGSGGWLGHFLLLQLVQLGHAAGVVLAPSLLTLALALINVPLLVYGLGLGRADWRGLARGGLWLSRGLWRGVAGATGALVRRRRHSTPRRGTGGGARRDPDVVARRASDPDADGLRAVAEDALVERREGAQPRVEKRAARPKAGKRAVAETQPTLDLVPGEYRLPPLSLLALPGSRMRQATLHEDALAQNARLLEAVLEDFGVTGEVTRVRPGPVVTLYELEPARGTKTSRVIGLADDIARSMIAISVRAAVVPGKNAIGIELPNATREKVYLRELLASTDYENSTAKLTLALGKDIAGAPVIADLARMPHLLIAGTTGSGKSVAVNTMILSLLYRLPPNECKLVLIDPKMLELSAYDGIPHLLTPVVVDPGKAVVALKWTVREMEERYRAMSRLGVRNITSFNQRLADARARGEDLKRTVQTGFDAETDAPVFEDEQLDLEPMPYIIVVVDEMADLMMLAGKEIEGTIQRLSQMARASGIHIIMATQRPSVDVITGTIKANFPTRVSFQVTSKVDSRTILGEQGAEQLLGSGDMLYMQTGGRITRVHGPYVSEEEVEAVVASLKRQGEPTYLEAVTQAPEDLDPLDTGPADELYDRAVALVCRERKASTSFIQRHLQIGYNRAARIVERMEQENVVTPANHAGKREVLAHDTFE